MFLNFHFRILIFFFVNVIINISTLGPKYTCQGKVEKEKEKEMEEEKTTEEQTKEEQTKQ